MTTPLQLGIMKTKQVLTILAASAALLCATTAGAANRFSVASGNWNDTATWSETSGGAAGASVPVAGDDVVIEGDDTVTVNITDAACTTLQVGSTTGTTTATARGTLTFSASGSPALTVSGSVSLGYTGDADRDGIITFTSGSTLSAGSLAIGGTTGSPGQGTITMVAGSTLNVGSITVNAGAGTWTPSTGTVVLTANNTLPASLVISFGNLTISSGTTTLGVDTTVSGVLTVDLGAALDASSRTLTLSGAGTPLVVNGTFTPSTSTVSYTSTSGANVTGGITYNNLSVNGGSGSDTWTLTGNATVNGTLTMPTGDTIADAGYTLTVKGNVSNSGAHSSTGSGKLLLNGNSSQTWGGTCGNVELDNAAGTSLSAAAVINGNLTITAGQLTAGQNLTVVGTTSISGTLALTAGATKSFGDVTINSGGTWNNSGNLAVSISGDLTHGGTTFTAGSGAYTFSGSGKTITGTISIPSVAITTGSKAISGALTVGTTLTLTSGGLTSAANLTLGNGATIARGTGTLDAAPAFDTSVNLTYANTVTTGNEVPALPTYASVLNNLTVSAGTINLGSAVQANGSVNISGGTLNTSGNNYALTIAGDLTVAGTLTPNGSTVSVGGSMSGSGTLSTSTSTFIFNGTGSQTINISGLANPFYDLTINKASGTATLGGAMTVSRNLTITAGTLATADFAVTLNGNFSNSGTFTAGSSAITIGGSGDQSIDGFTTTGTVSKTGGGTATFQGNVNGGALTINASGGGLNLGSGLTHAFTGTWTRTAGTLNCASSTLRLGSGFSGTGGTFTRGTGTVEWNAAGAQTIAAVTYHNLIFSGSGTKTMNASTAVAGNLSIAPTGTATASIAAGQNLVVNSLTLGGSPQVSGTWGSTSSAAVNQNDTYFAATTGILTVGATRMVVTLPGQTFASGSGNSGTVNNQTAGTSFNITLTAADANNNIDTSYSGTKTISYSGPGNAPGGATPTYTTTVNFTAGQAAAVATTLVRAESTTITASAAGLTGVASSSLTVNPEAANKLGFGTQPSNTADAAAISPAVTVQVQDTYGNVVTSSTAPVTMAIGNNPASGVLRGTLTVNAASGVATFSDLHIWEIGSGYTLTASSSPLTGATSSAFNITQGVGDYRSAGTGTWATLATWERWDGSTWATPANAPTAANAGTIIIRNGHVVTAAANAGGDSIRVEAGGQLTISGGTFTVANGTGTDLEVYGTVRNASAMTMTGTGVFQSGGKYQHNINGGTVITATWDVNSTCEITGATSTAPGGLGQAFGNFTWNPAAQAANNLNLSGNLTTVNGDFTVVNTGTSGSLRLTATTSPTLTIGGNLNVQGGKLVGGNNTGIVTINLAGDLSVTGGTLDLKDSSGATGGGCTLNVSGNVTVGSGATLTGSNGTRAINFAKAGTQTYSNSGTVSGLIAWTVNSSSTVDVGTSVISGTSGTFTLSSGGGLKTAHASGLDGNITVTGTKTFAADGNYTYNGSVAQVPGSLLPATLNNLTIANAAGVTINSTHTVSGVCTIESGALLLGTGTINGSVILNGAVGPGASVGTLATGNETWNGGGSYVWEINDADGSAGTDPGWDRLNAGANTIDVAATSGDKFNLTLTTLNGGSAGQAADFSADSDYTWQIAASGNLTGFDAGDFAINDTAFQNDLKGGTFSVEQSGNNVNLKFTRNQAPVANNATYTRVKGTAWKIPIATLLADKTSDPEAAGTALTAVGSAVNGSVSSDSTFIYFEPSTETSGSFDYTVKDLATYRVGDTIRTATATVTVNVAASYGSGQAIAYDSGGVTVTFSAIPGFGYDVERAEDVNFTVNLTNLVTTNAPADGQFSVTDGSPPNPTGYYRLKYNP